MELIEKKDFVVAAPNLEHEFFIVHIATFNINIGDKMYPSKRAQIAFLKVNKAPTKVFSEYANFVDVFLQKLVAKLPKHTRINNYAIELIDN